MNAILEQTERELLGYILSDNRHFHEAAQHIAVTDFSLSSHGAIFRAMAQLFEGGRPVDFITVSQRLSEMDALTSVGGMAYLTDLTSGLLFHRNDVTSHIAAINRASLLRNIERIGGYLSNAAAESGNDPDDLLRSAEERLLELRAQSTAGDHVGLAEAMPLAVRVMRRERERTSELLGLTTGIPALDKITRGIQPGENQVVGSASGQGKTAFLVQATVANCLAGVPVQLFSLEMTREQLIRRILAVVSGVPFFRVRDPRQASASEMAEIERAADKVAKWPLFIEDAAGLTISKIVAKARLAVRRHGVKLIGVDYAQIVNAQGKDERLRVASISRALTALAKDEQVPVITLSQLSRPDRTAKKSRPRMSDLRESSQLENDAHVVILIHREMDDEFGKLSTNGELIVAKQRSGETGAFPITFDKRSLTFRAATPIS